MIFKMLYASASYQTATPNLRMELNDSLESRETVKLKTLDFNDRTVISILMQATNFATVCLYARKCQHNYMQWLIRS